METKIVEIGKLDHVNLFYDPLRKNDSFLVLKSGDIKMGYIVNDDVIFESNFNYTWDQITSIVGGFKLINTYEKIKNKINESKK